MRALIQRVQRANVSIDDSVRGAIEHGFLVFIGIEVEDGQEDIDWLAPKIAKLRVFSDDEGRMNRSIVDVEGAALVISQFTLYAAVKKGSRPSFIRSAAPEIAVPLYESFIDRLSKEIGKPVATGEFGADMAVSLLNDGPVTIWIDTKNRE